MRFYLVFALVASGLAHADRLEMFPEVADSDMSTNVYAQAGSGALEAAIAGWLGSLPDPLQKKVRAISAAAAKDFGHIKALESELAANTPESHARDLVISRETIALQSEELAAKSNYSAAMKLVTQVEKDAELKEIKLAMGFAASADGALIIPDSMMERYKELATLEAVTQTEKELRQSQALTRLGEARRQLDDAVARLGGEARASFDRFPPAIERYPGPGNGEIYARQIERLDTPAGREAIAAARGSYRQQIARLTDRREARLADVTRLLKTNPRGLEIVGKYIPRGVASVLVVDAILRVFTIADQRDPGLSPIGTFLKQTVKR